MGFLPLAGLVPEQGDFVGQGQDLAGTDLGFIPLEHQKLAGLQHAEALGEALSKIVLPVGSEHPVLESHPAVTASADQVWRIEHHEVEGVVVEGQLPKVYDDVGFNVQNPAITEQVLFVADIPEQRVLTVLVKPEHSGAAAWVEDHGTTFNADLPRARSDRFAMPSSWRTSLRRSINSQAARQCGHW